MKIMKYLIIAMMFLVATAAHAVDLTGSYYCKGYDPYANLKYGGPVTIKKSGKTYTVSWNLGQNQVYVGTGLLNENTSTFSVLFYNDVNVKSAGLSVYQVMPNGVLDGHWVMNDEDRVGTETCVRQ